MKCFCKEFASMMKIFHIYQIEEKVYEYAEGDFSKENILDIPFIEENLIIFS